MNTKEALRHPIEAFRTAPLGISFAIGGLCMTGGLAPAAIHESFTTSDALNLAGATVNILLGISFARQQFKLQEKVERFTEVHGFDDRFFVKTTAEWCDRQTTRVVCERYGLLDQYEELCENNKQNSYLTYIPHI